MSASEIDLPPAFIGQRSSSVAPTPVPVPAASVSCGVFVGNLPLEVTNDVLTELLLQAGPLAGDVRLLRDSTGAPKGSAFCDYIDSASAGYAIVLFDGLTLGGRKLRVNSATRDGAPPPAPQLLSQPAERRPDERRRADGYMCGDLRGDLRSERDYDDRHGGGDRYDRDRDRYDDRCRDDRYDDRRRDDRYDDRRRDDRYDDRRRDDRHDDRRRHDDRYDDRRRYDDERDRRHDARRRD